MTCKIEVFNGLKYQYHSSCRGRCFPTAQEVAACLSDAGPQREIDLARLTLCVENSGVFITVRNKRKRLVGFLRAITDWTYCAYACSAAVLPRYRRRGVWRKMNDELRRILGPGVTILALSRTESAPYFPAIGFQQAKRAWIIPRVR
jgi:hypothetical protein